MSKRYAIINLPLNPCRFNTIDVAKFVLSGKQFHKKRD
jgi:hypothetical protein